MKLRTSRYPRTDTLCPYTTLFRSQPGAEETVFGRPHPDRQVVLRGDAHLGDQRQMVGGLQGRAVIEHARVGDLPLRREIDPVQAELGPADRVGRYAHTGREDRKSTRLNSSH